MIKLIKRILKALWEPVSDFIIFIGADTLVKELFKNTTGRVGGKITEHVLTDQRAEILEDFRRMKLVETANLIRRHKESIQELRENRFVALLCKIPKGRRGRRLTLRYLNDLPDPEFWQMLYLLEHDVVPQWLERMRRTGAKILKSDLDRLGEMVKKVGAVLPSGDSIADWAEGLPGAGADPQPPQSPRPPLQRTATSLWRSTNFLLRWALRIIIISLTLILLAGIWWPKAMPALALAFLVAIAYILTDRPLITAALGFTPILRPILRWILTATGLVLIMGAYLWIVPIRNDQGLAFLLVVLFFAYSCFRLANRCRWLRGLLLVAFAIGTLVLLLGGRDKAGDKVGEQISKISTAAQNQQKSPVEAKAPPPPQKIREEAPKPISAVSPPETSQVPTQSPQVPEAHKGLYVEYASLKPPRTLFSEGNLELRIRGCQRQETGQVRCSGYASWKGPEKCLLIFSSLEARSEGGAVYHASVGEFGGFPCFTPSLTEPSCWKQLFPGGDELSLSFAIEDYDKSGSISVIMPFFYRGTTAREAVFRIPVED